MRPSVAARAPEGASPDAVKAGHWMVWLAGHETTTGAAWSSTVRVWLQVAELPQSSVAVQVRRTLLTAGQLTGTASSEYVTLRFPSQASAKVGAPKLGCAGHWMV